MCGEIASSVCGWGGVRGGWVCNLLLSDPKLLHEPQSVQSLAVCLSLSLSSSLSLSLSLCLSLPTPSLSLSFSLSLLPSLSLSLSTTPSLCVCVCVCVSYSLVSDHDLLDQSVQSLGVVHLDFCSSPVEILQFHQHGDMWLQPCVQAFHLFTQVLSDVCNRQRGIFVIACPRGAQQELHEGGGFIGSVKLLHKGFHTLVWFLVFRHFIYSHSWCTRMTKNHNCFGAKPRSVGCLQERNRSFRHDDLVQEVLIGWRPVHTRDESEFVPNWAKWNVWIHPNSGQNFSSRRCEKALTPWHNSVWCHLICNTGC